VIVLGEAADADGVLWYEVLYGEINGYIRSDLLEIVEAEIEPEITPEPEQNETVLGRTLAEHVNMRSAADVESEVVGVVVGMGSEVIVLSEAADADGVIWYEVLYGEINGYIRSDLLEIVEAEVEPEATPEPEQNETVLGLTLAERVNMRGAADVESEVVGVVVGMGSEVIVLGEAADAEGVLWYEVLYGEISGYIRSDLLEIVEAEVEPEETPVPEIEYQSWQPGQAETMLSYEVEGALGYVWQSGIKDENGELVWTDIPQSNSTTFLMSVNMESLKQHYRCVAVKEANELVISDEITLIDAGLVQWMNEGEVTEKMLVRAMNAKSLESMVIEDELVVYVRTGEVYARIDKATGYMIDENTGLVIAMVDMENSLIYPMAMESTDEK